ncbi:DUF6746 family protein [Thiopseudomonas alkaliphila]|nr:DUF6746 family protein [Thiopseudomonas alkaliphila]
MKKMLNTAVLAAGLMMGAGAVVADDRVDHFKGEPSPTLEAAVKNFSEYNNRLEAIVKKGEYTDEDLVQIHQLTYTLEVALEKMEEELDDLADVLEEVHVASETFDREKLKKNAPLYLETSRKIVK